MLKIKGRPLKYNIKLFLIILIFPLLSVYGSKGEDPLENQLSDFKLFAKELEKSGMINSDGSVNRDKVDIKKAQKILEKMGHSGDPSKILKKLTKQLSTALGDQSDKDLGKDLKLRFSDSILGPLFDRIPKFYDFLAKIMKDKEALPSLTGVFSDRKKLLWFLGVNITLSLLIFFIKRRRRGKVRSFLGSIFSTFSRILVTFSLRVIIFILFFGNFVSPLWNIFQDVYL